MTARQPHLAFLRRAYVYRRHRLPMTILLVIAVITCCRFAGEHYITYSDASGSIRCSKTSCSPSKSGYSTAIRPSSTTTYSSKRCDDECSRLRGRISSWSPDRPRAAVVMLLRRESLPFFRHSMNLFHNNSNSKYRYPIIIFHEADLELEPERDHFRASVPDPVLLYFQHVKFKMPSFVNKSAVPHIACFKTIRYRHMCRFHAKTLYDEPILAGLRYVWRLDDDSYILRPIGYDVFRLMADRHIRYGYAKIQPECPPCIDGLWRAADLYAEKNGLRQRFQWPREDIFYNNFEVSDMELWRSREYRHFIEYIDRLGGIFYTRWGDHAIKTVAVTLFVSLNATHHFNDIAYEHGRINVTLN